MSAGLPQATELTGFSTSRYRRKEERVVARRAEGGVAVLVPRAIGTRRNRKFRGWNEHNTIISFSISFCRCKERRGTHIKK